MKSTLILALLFVSTSVIAAQPDRLNLSVGLLYENSDNILLTQANTKKSENIYHALMSMSYKKESSKLSTSFTLDADRRSYQNNTFPDETVVSSLLGLTANLSKKRLYWDLVNRYARVQTNAASLDLPTNRENTNYFSTGPRFVFFQNDKNSLNADIKYEKFYTETSDGDYSGYLVDTSYIRNISRTFSLGIAAKYNDRKFDNIVLNTNYTKADLILSLIKKMKISDFEIDVGRTRINQQLYNNKNEQGIFRAFYNYKLGAKTDLKLSYRRELNDFSGLFSSATTGGTILSNVSSSIFLLEEGSLSIFRRFGSSGLTFSYTNFSNDYSVDSLDLKNISSSLTFSNKISPSISLNLNGTYIASKYPGISRNDTRRIYSTGIVKTFLDKYDIAFDIHYINNRSTDSNFIYDERRISLGGHYYF